MIRHAYSSSIAPHQTPTSHRNESVNRVSGDQVGDTSDGRPFFSDTHHRRERLSTSSLESGHRSSGRGSGRVLLAPTPLGKLVVSNLAWLDLEAPSPVHLQYSQSYLERHYATIVRIAEARRPKAAAADLYRMGARRHPSGRRWVKDMTESQACWTRFNSKSRFW